jgi:hypothetical protein
MHREIDAEADSKTHHVLMYPVPLFPDDTRSKTWSDRSESG